MMTTFTIDAALTLPKSHFSSIEEAVETLSALIDPERTMISPMDKKTYKKAQSDYQQQKNITDQKAIEMLMKKR